MSATPYTAVIRRDGKWWIGWVEEVPGVNSQGETREELLSNLREALNEAIEMNREDARNDLPPLNVTTFRERISGGANQGRARDATREEVHGGADHREAPRG